MGTACNETDLQWQTELIVKRGRRMGFMDTDLDDAIQEIAPHIINFRFDPARSNGASLRTVLIAVIDRRLLAIRRREARYAKCLGRARVASGMSAGHEDQRPEPGYEDTVPMELDVRTALARLSEDERLVCEALSHGCSIQEVADRLGCDWHSVNRRVTRIREQFIRWGLDGWLDAA
jgi:RNA polymerase sigma factor (sigma-70 family)